MIYQKDSSTFSLDDHTKTHIRSILKKFKKEERKQKDKIVLISFPQLYRLFTTKERILLKQFLKLSPRRLGFHGSFLGIRQVPRNLVPIRGQTYREKKQRKKIPTQYVPPSLYLAYHRLLRKIQGDLDRPLLIYSAYRSPAYQLMTFLHYLHFYHFDLIRTARRVALPGYSEHGFPPRQAVDFITIFGSPSDERPLAFAQTREYRWLLKNANTFSFYLSYPKGNMLGVIFEPWHWHYRK